LGRSVLEGFKKMMKIAPAADAVENVGKAKRFFAELFPSTSWKSSERRWPKAYLIRFPQVRHFQQRFAPGVFQSLW